MNERMKLLLAFVSALCCANATAAEKYPVRPIRLVVASSPGGASDILARMIARKMSEDLGQQIVVDNRAGASGVIGTDIVAKAVPDGHTLLIIQPTLTINPSMIRKLPYDTERDLAPVSLAVDAAQILTAHPALPAKDAAGVIALAKAQPGKLAFGSPGIGTSPHLTAELFKLRAGIDVPQVQFKGSGMAFVSLMSGEVSLAFSTVLSALPHIKGGKIRALGVTSAKRVQVLPEVPTIAETALPGFETSQWFGFLVPARTPRAIVERLYETIARATDGSDIRNYLAAQGVEVVNRRPEEFARQIRHELKQWAEVIRAAGIKPE